VTVRMAISGLRGVFLLLLLPHQIFLEDSCADDK
jgi:hypothetical protein